MKKRRSSRFLLLCLTVISLSGCEATELTNLDNDLVLGDNSPAMQHVTKDISLGGDSKESIGDDLKFDDAQVVTDFKSTQSYLNRAVEETFQDVTELKVEDQQLGQGALAQAGSRIQVQYIGRLITGKSFDQSKQPFEFTLGSNQVIPGWERGIVGMRVGGKRRLHIPANLGYGQKGVPPIIPSGATLVFDVELLSVQ